MRKLLSILLIAIMALSLVACNDKSEETQPPTEPPELDEYTLVFTNDGMSLDLEWEILNKVINGEHKDAELMSEAITKNEAYFADLIKLKVVVYNLDNIKDTGIQTTLYPNVSLLGDCDVTVSTVKPEAGSVTYIGDKYPMERLHQMLRLGFENYGVQITGIYKYGYGEKTNESTFKLAGKLTFDNKTDASQLHTGKLTLTDTGAELDIKYSDLLEEFGLDIETFSGHVSETFESIGVMLYTSKHESSIGTMDIVSISAEPEARPEEWHIQLKYDRAWLNNKALMEEYTAVGQEMYAELMLTLTAGEFEDACTFFLRCEIEDKRSAEMPTKANPKTATEFTQTFVEGEDMMPFVLYAPGDDVGITANTPMIIWLHGSGECQSSEETYLTRGLPAVLNNWELNDFNAYIVCPICPSSSWTKPGYVEEIQKIIDYMTTHYPVDVKNISLAGHSLGGIGAQYFGGKMSDTFARIAVLSGYSCDQLDNVTVPIRGFVGTDDGGSYSYMMSEKILEKMPTTVVEGTHAQVPYKTFTIDENQDGFSDVFMWLVGAE